MCCVPQYCVSVSIPIGTWKREAERGEVRERGGVVVATVGQRREMEAWSQTHQRVAREYQAVPEQTGYSYINLKFHCLPDSAWADES